MASKPRKKNEIKETKKKSVVSERRDTNKEKFLAKLEETPVIQVAAAQTGIDRSTYYRWRREDRDFSHKCDGAHERGVEFVNDMMESILIKNAKNDNMTAVIFWLKNHSAQYNDKRYVEHHHTIEEVLTDEKKAEIGAALAAWDMDDPNFEEYEVDWEPERKPAKGPREYDEEGNLIR